MGTFRQKLFSFVMLTSLLGGQLCADDALLASLPNDSLEMLFFELRQTALELWEKPKVRNTVLIATALSIAGYLIYRTYFREGKSGRAHKRYAGLIKKKEQEAQWREEQKVEREHMRTSLGLPRDTRGLGLESIRDMLPPIYYTPKLRSEEEHGPGLHVSGELLKGAAIGSALSSTVLFLYFGQTMQRGLVFEKLRNLMPSALSSEDKSPVLGWLWRGLSACALIL